MDNYTQSQVESALKQLGHYRCIRVQDLANEGAPDGISGAHLLGLGLRETGLKNIRGGAIFEKGRWIKQPDPNQQDVGFTQISMIFHESDLALMPGVVEGTWGPTIVGHSAADAGFCPRFTDAVRFTLDEMHEAQAYAEDHGVPSDKLARFAVAAHNAGQGGALSGFRAGDLDKNTTGRDYSDWVLKHIPLIRKALDHLKWRP